MVNIYVGNLPYSTTDAELRQVFEAHGSVDRAVVLVDRATGRSRGFGFVEMTNDAEGLAAIDALNGSDLGGRALIVSKARAKTEGGEPRGREQ